MDQLLGCPVKRTTPITIIAIALASIAATYNPLVGQWLVYDRSAILDGEIWRLVAGHLYHFSPLHLWCNLVPLVLVGACVERQSRSWFICVCLMMGIAVGVSLFFAYPSMDRFGGGSGLVCGLFAYFGLSGVNARGRIGTVCRITLIVILLKIGYELYTGDALWVDWDEQGFVVMPLSHVVGCLSGSICLLVQPVIGMKIKVHPMNGLMDRSRSVN
jgi:rhomboid family GlyGly-CTERM serine protease